MFNLIKFLLGKNPEPDRVLDCDKRDLPKDEENHVVEALDKYLEEQESKDV